MTVAPNPGGVPIAGGSANAHSALARFSVGLAAVVAVTVAVSYAIFAVAFAIGGDDAVSDTWVGYLGGISLLGGLLASFGAFVLALVARSRHERWTLLRVPLAVFPALFALVVLAEAFLME